MSRSRTKSTSATGSNDKSNDIDPGSDTEPAATVVPSTSPTTTKLTTPGGPASAPTPKADKKLNSSSSRLTKPTAATVARQKELEAANAVRAEKGAKAKKAAKAVKAAEASREAKAAKLKAEKHAAKEAKEAKAKAEKEPKNTVQAAEGSGPTMERSMASLERKKGMRARQGMQKQIPTPTMETARAAATATATATATSTKTSTSLTKRRNLTSSSADQKGLDLAVTTLTTKLFTTQCTSILEALDEQVQINQALVSDVEKLRQENKEFRKENTEIKRRLEKIEGIVINILGGDDPPMEVETGREGGVGDRNNVPEQVEGVEEVEGVKLLETPKEKEKEKERRRSGRKRKSSAIAGKEEEEMGALRKTRRVTLEEGKGKKYEVVY